MYRDFITNYRAVPVTFLRVNIYRFQSWIDFTDFNVQLIVLKLLENIYSVGSPLYYFLTVLRTFINTLCSHHEKYTFYELKIIC